MIVPILRAALQQFFTGFKRRLCSKQPKGADLKMLKVPVAGLI